MIEIRPLPLETKRLLKEGESNVGATVLGEYFWELIEGKIDKWLDKHDHYDLQNVLQHKLATGFARLVVLRRMKRQSQDGE